MNGTCPNQDCLNNDTIFELDEESVYCPKCGMQLVEYSEEDENEELEEEL